jgi:hypothetical protein
MPKWEYYSVDASMKRGRWMFDFSDGEIPEEDYLDTLGDDEWELGGFALDTSSDVR